MLKNIYLNPITMARMKLKNCALYILSHCKKINTKIKFKPGETTSKLHYLKTLI